jgi:hypothetical protein
LKGREQEKEGSKDYLIEENGNEMKLCVMKEVIPVPKEGEL